MKTMPTSIRDAIPSDLLADADRWWSALSSDDRDELFRLCDSRREIFLFETFDPSQENPRISGGKFIPHDDGFGIREWGEDYFDTLLSNPELMIVYAPAERTFRIGCHRHPAARMCFERGAIGSDFACPLKQEVCLMDQIRGGRSIVGLQPRDAEIGTNAPTRENRSSESDRTFSEGNRNP